MTTATEMKTEVQEFAAQAMSVAVPGSEKMGNFLNNWYNSQDNKVRVQNGWNKLATEIVAKYGIFDAVLAFAHSFTQPDLEAELPRALISEFRALRKEMGVTDILSDFCLRQTTDEGYAIDRFERHCVAFKARMAKEVAFHKKVMALA